MNEGFAAPDPDFAMRVRDSFGRQNAMALIGAELTEIVPGRVRIELPYRDDLTQQHKFIHGGITTMIADAAAGYAAFTLFPADASVLTVEFKVSLIAPAKGERLIATGTVVKPGRTLTLCDIEVHAIDAGQSKLILKGLETLICLHGRADR